MKRIGIITFYYKNYNYGGLLQAYALENYINDNWKEKCIAEQICYDKNAVPISFIDRTLRFVCRGNIIKKLSKRKPSGQIIQKNVVCSDKTQMQLAMGYFAENSVRHSAVVYDENSFSESQKNYDMYVCGSDQIWNPLAIRDAYLLKKISKWKVSYAASIAAGNLKLIECLRYKKPLADLDMISVRENSAAIQLEKLLQKHVPVVVDPTLLLTPDKWKSLIGVSKFKSRYAFAYFLNAPSSVMIQVMDHFEKDTGVKIISISGTYMINDFRCVEACEPLFFLSLIQNACMVFTDSFHAMAFSVQFKTKFLISERQSSEIDMSERINSFFGLTGLTNALVTENTSGLLFDIEYDFEKAHRAIDKERIKSREYIACAIRHLFE